MQHAKTAIVDATIVSSAARPRRVMEVQEVADGEGSTSCEVKVEESKDADARWLQKGQQFYFGYKLHTRTDDAGYVEKIHISPANAHESRHLKESVKGCHNNRVVLADKGYSSKENREMLCDQHLRDGIMHKGTRAKKLSKAQKKFNRQVMKFRYRIAQTFGTLKRKFRFYRSSYLGMQKTLAQAIMKCMCLNLLKAANMIQI